VKAITPDVPFLPPDFFFLEVVIVPRWGIYANLIAQMISQISSHFIIHYHRLIVRDASKKYQERHASIQQALTVHTAEDSDETSSQMEGKNKHCLKDTAFARPHKGDSHKLVARENTSYALVFGTVLLNLFLIMGCAIPSMSIDVQGLIGFVSQAGLGTYKEFDVFSIAKVLMDDGRSLGGANFIMGYFLLSSVLVITVFIVPIAQSFTLVHHWFRPMIDSERKWYSVVIEVLGAWQYAEVFILALFVGSW
jgi:hypothetical protein